MRQYFVFLFKMTTLTFPHLLLWLRHNCLVNNVGLTDSCFYTSQWHGTAVRSFQSFQIPLDLSFFEFHIFEHTQQLYNAIHPSIRIYTITILLLWTWCLKTQKGSSSFFPLPPVFWTADSESKIPAFRDFSLFFKKCQFKSLYSPVGNRLCR